METYEPESRPSVLRRFVRGFTSGAINGALMLGIFTGVVFLASLTPAVSIVGTFVASKAFGMAAIATLATALFSGVLAVKRGAEEAEGQEAPVRRTNEVSANTPVVVPTVGAAMAQSQETGSDVSEDTSVPPAPGQESWVKRTGRNPAGANIQRIIANQEMSDKSRAAAILAEREATANKAASIA